MKVEPIYSQLMKNKTQVKTTPHAARGNNTQARGKLQTADETQKRAYE
jgi:hypothetical protein